MKRRTVGLLVLVMVLVAVLIVPSVASAANFVTVTITATPVHYALSITYNDAHDSSWGIGDAAESTNGYWWDDEGGAQAAAAEPVGADDCAGNISNDSSVSVDIDTHGHVWAGGVTWALGGSVGENVVVLKSLQEGDANEAAYLTLTTEDQEDISNLSATGTKGVDLHLETGTFTDGVAKSSSVTYTCRAVT